MEDGTLQQTLMEVMKPKEINARTGCLGCPLAEKKKTNLLILFLKPKVGNI
jgi:hypothetical protein